VVSELQKFRIKELNNYGCIARIVTSIEEL